MIFRLYINEILWMETRDTALAFESFRKQSEARKDWPRKPAIRLSFIVDKKSAA